MESERYYNILVTGGCGFIGWNLLRMLFTTNLIKFNKVINLDRMDYAAINPIKDSVYDDRYQFVQTDITYASHVIENNGIDLIFNLAAYSHVDNSIDNCDNFVHSNIVGAYKLMDDARRYWEKNNISGRFIQVSTDEVFGHVINDPFMVTSEIRPNNPYSATKASAELMATSLYKTYGFPVVITNCSNNFGPGQHAEKLIPKTIYNALNGLTIPIYGDGLQRRDWLYVDDHCAGLILAAKADVIPIRDDRCPRFVFGTDTTVTNLEIVNNICLSLSKKLDRPITEFTDLITHVEDRKGHDRVYQVNWTTSYMDLGWAPATLFDVGLESTIDWYINKNGIS